MVPVAERPLAIFLLGPTAAGKTDLAVALAEQLSVEIISVDSAMVYRGLDIGTAKPDAELRVRVPHRLIDIRDPANPYSVAEFLADARGEMASITAAGRIPLLVGGTMLYFRALLDGLTELPAACPEVRRELAQEAEAVGWPQLHARLAAIDPATAAILHPNQAQRIQRALEIFALTGVPLSTFNKQRHHPGRGIPPISQHYRILQLTLVPRDRSRLHAAIARRFQHMLELGLLDEVTRLYERGDLAADLPAVRAVGYRQVWGFLAGAYGYHEMVARSLAATRQLAKRQLTWLRNWDNAGVAASLVLDPAELSATDILTNSLRFMRTSPVY